MADSSKSLARAQYKSHRAKTARHSGRGRGTGGTGGGRGGSSRKSRGAGGNLDELGSNFDRYAEEEDDLDPYAGPQRKSNGADLQALLDEAAQHTAGNWEWKRSFDVGGELDLNFEAIGAGKEAQQQNLLKIDVKDLAESLALLPLHEVLDIDERLIPEDLRAVVAPPPQPACPAMQSTQQGITPQPIERPRTELPQPLKAPEAKSTTPSAYTSAPTPEKGGIREEGSEVAEEKQQVGSGRGNDGIDDDDDDDDDGNDDDDLDALLGASVSKQPSLAIKVEDSGMDDLDALLGDTGPSSSQPNTTRSVAGTQASQSQAKRTAISMVGPGSKSKTSQPASASKEQKKDVPIEDWLDDLLG